MTKQRILIVAAVLSIAGLFVVAGAQTQGDKAQFSRTTIDLGVVVSDVEKAAKFYTEAIGFQQVGSFDVAGHLARDTGLTDNRPFQVRVFALGSEPTATNLKIMEVPGAGSKKVDNQYISSSLGFSYLTIMVANIDKATARLARNGVAPVKPAYQLGGNNYLILVKDPDGNIIELIGPKQYRIRSVGVGQSEPAYSVSRSAVDRDCFPRLRGGRLCCAPRNDIERMRLSAGVRRYAARRA